MFNFVVLALVSFFLNNTHYLRQVSLTFTSLYSCRAYSCSILDNDLFSSIVKENKPRDIIKNRKSFAPSTIVNAIHGLY